MLKAGGGGGACNEAAAPAPAALTALPPTQRPASPGPGVPAGAVVREAATQSAAGGPESHAAGDGVGATGPPLAAPAPFQHLLPPCSRRAEPLHDGPAPDPRPLQPHLPFTFHLLQSGVLPLAAVSGSEQAQWLQALGPGTRWPALRLRQFCIALDAFCAGRTCLAANRFSVVDCMVSLRAPGPCRLGRAASG